jgi:serine/threonine protein kinase
VKSYGYSGDYNILVMELMGKSLEDLLTTRQEKKLSVKSVCMLADQMLTILEQVHSKHIIHRDIKPDNFVMGLGDNSKYLYLLDFGLARKYRSSTTGLHYPMKNRKKLTGTARYASINALKGLEQSRRDDLEAIGYVLMYFLRGSLPWQGLPVKTKEDRYKKIMEKKQSTSPEELCTGFPQEFAEYIHYTRKLTYEEEPDYNYLRNLFRSIMQKNNYEFDYLYDWTVSVRKPTPSESNQPELGNNSILINQMQSSNLNIMHNKENVGDVINKTFTGLGVNCEIVKNSTFKENGLAPIEGTPTVKENLNLNVKNFDSNKNMVRNDSKTLVTNKTPVIISQKNNYINPVNSITPPYNQLSASYTNCNININLTNTATATANCLTNNNNFNTLQAQRNDSQNIQCITNPNINFNNYVTPIPVNASNKSNNGQAKGSPTQIPLKKSKKEKGCCIL